MKNIKNNFFLILTILILTVIAGCGGDNETQASKGAESYTLNIGHDKPTDHHYHKISERFAELVSERTDGKVNIKIYPSNQLGGVRELVEGAMAGTQDMVITTGGVLSNWAPNMGMLSLPYLFDDYDQVYEVLHSEIGEQLKAELKEENAIVLGWWVNGFRNVTNSDHEILEPSDIEGIKIRTPESPISIAIFKELGALPTPMGSGELYTALQQGTVDAQESSFTQTYKDRYYEVQEYLSVTKHMYTVEPILISRKKFESLPEEYQQVLKDTATELEQEHVEMVKAASEEALEELKKNGMKVSEVDREAFKEATRPVYDDLRDMFDGELLDKLIEATK